jgi:cell division septation protein DedD
VAQSIAAAAAIAPEAPAAFAMMSSSFAPAPEPAAAPKKAPARPAAKKASGDSKAVVQLGAYSSAERVSVAWERLTKKYPVLANYSPMRARFDSPKGTVWRLSIQGFDSQREAIAQCHTLRNRGGNCFVRSSAGDSPVQFASR